MNNKKIELFEGNELKIYSERDRKPGECKLPSDILVPVKNMGYKFKLEDTNIVSFVTTPNVHRGYKVPYITVC